MKPSERIKEIRKEVALKAFREGLSLGENDSIPSHYHNLAERTAVENPLIAVEAIIQYLDETLEDVGDPPEGM